MTFIPFARKYRPQTFDELIGQPHVTETLSRALKSQRIAQAYLFAGLRGVGKTSAARILAKCLNCERGPTPTPCNTCTNCTHITRGNSLDVSEIDGASNRGIDEIRRLRESVPFAPTSGRFRVYIVDEVHMLTAEAFNALLKTLEEPPAHAKFIFATTMPAKIPATVLSRCQRFDFRRLEVATIVQVLQALATSERLAVEEPALYAIARAAEGSLRDAEVILEQLASFAQGSIRETDVTALLGSIESEALFAWSEAILNRDAPQALGVLCAQLDQGREPPQLLSGLLRHIRNLLVVSSVGKGAANDPIVARLVDEPAERLTRLSEHAARSSPAELLMFLQILASAYELVRRSPMAQTILELVVIKLATRDQWQSLEDISRRLEQALSDQPPTPSGRQPIARTEGALSQTTATPAPRSQEPVSLAAAPMASEEAATDAPDLASLWPSFLEQLGARKMSLAGYLAESKPLHVERGVLTVGLPAFALHHEVLAALENRRLIERLLSDVCQAPVTVQYATLPEPVEPMAASTASPAEEPTPPIVQDIVKLFNATIVDRPPRAASP